MELSPILYHCFVRPRWLTKLYIDNIIKSNFDFYNKTVLDFGCGIGSSSSMFTPTNYLGIDPDPKRVDYARHLYPEHRFDVLQEKRLPVVNKSVDYILIIAVLHHIPSEELSDYLQKFHRVLKSYGKILVIEPCFFKNSHFNNHFMAFFDNGKYIRNMDGYFQLFYDNNYQINTVKRYKKLSFYNELFFSAVPN